MRIDILSNRNIFEPNQKFDTSPYRQILLETASATGLIQSALVCLKFRKHFIASNKLDLYRNCIALLVRFAKSSIHENFDAHTVRVVTYRNRQLVCVRVHTSLSTTL
jgi:hypothetical protein